MSSFSRRHILAAIAVAPLAGCGFEPVYGTGGAGTVLRGRLRIQPPQDRLGFVLVSRLEERLGRASNPAYVLTYTLTTSSAGLAITGADDITRNTLNGTLRFQVTEAGSDVQVQAGHVSTFTAYSTTGSPVATAAALRDAEDRLMIGLADQVVSRLLSSADNWT